MSKSWLGFMAIAGILGGAVVAACGSSSDDSTPPGGSGGGGGSVVGGGGTAGTAGGGTGGTGARDSGTGGKGGSGGSAGSTGPVLGSKCATDADCASANLKCVGPGSNEFLGGGVAGGYCTIDCTESLNIEGGTDPCPTKTDDTNAICVDSSPANAPGTKAWCVQGCAKGPPINNDYGKFDTKKCHGRHDVACWAMDEADTIRGCRPVCIQDADCGGGKICDPGEKVCLTTPSAGLPFGSNCAEWSLSSGDAGTRCQGICINAIKQDDASRDDTQNNIGHFCAESCVYGAIESCGHTLSPPRGVCIWVVQNSGNGDAGFCGPQCDKDSDCLDWQDRAYCYNTQEVITAWGRGLCQYRFGPILDAMPSDAPPADASAD